MKFKSSIIFFMMSLFIMPFITAVTIESGTILTSEGLNTSLEILTELIVDEFNVSNASIFLANFTYDGVNYGDLDITTPNKYYFDSDLPELFLFHGITLYYKLNENSGTTAYDSSGNLNHGTISDATWNNDGILLTLTEGFDYVLNPYTGLLTMNSQYVYDYVMTSFEYLEGYGFHVTILNLLAGLVALVVLIAIVVYVVKLYEDYT